jgi:hypothetical protein
MSRAAGGVDLDALSPPVCDTCGCFILEEDQECPALDDGVCAP